MANLPVPYFSQRDNQLNPSGSCNITCVAMALAYLGVKGNGQGRLPDQLYRYMEANNLSRHSPQDLAYLVNSRYGPGIKDDFRADRTIKDIIQALDTGKVVVVHGYFTQSGHIILIKGYDPVKKAFICHDPWGEWYNTGYDRRPSEGKDEVYSYAMISRLCEDPGDPSSIWAHFIYR